MSDEKRPGGLTALAVLNFIFGGFNALGLLAMVAFFAVIQSDAEASNEAEQAMRNAFSDNLPVFLAIVGFSALYSILMIASGVGYLKQKKFLGRTLGNTSAVLAIAFTALSASQTPVEAGGGFNIGTVISLIYPLLTLVLLNTTFKHDFTR